MFGSGVRIGMVITLPQGQQIPKGHHRVDLVCSAAAAGTTSLITAVLRSASGAIPATGTSTSGSGLFSLPVRSELRQAPRAVSGAERNERPLGQRAALGCCGYEGSFIKTI